MIKPLYYYSVAFFLILYYINILNMSTSDKHNERIASMTFSSVFPCYVEKIEKKGKTSKDELYKVIEWFTGFNNEDINKAIVQKWTFKELFDCAKLNDNSFLIKGSICGHKIEAIENSLTQNVRRLDKIVDELAKGEKIEKILR